MKPETAKRIMQVWDDLENDNPEKSTEWLMQMTADVAKVPYENVITALEIQSRAGESP